MAGETVTVTDNFGDEIDIGTDEGNVMITFLNDEHSVLMALDAGHREQFQRAFMAAERQAEAAVRDPAEPF